MTGYKIAITGHFRVGKDTFADMLAEIIPGPVVKLHFADALKREVAEMVFNYVQPEGEMEYTRYPIPYKPNQFYEAAYAKRGAYGRWNDQMLADRAANGLAWQWWGEWRRQHDGPDYWILHPLFQNQYNRAMDTGASVIVSDMRHENEAEWCREQGFYLVRVEGPCRAEGERRDPKHASEIHIDKLPVDRIVSNAGSLHWLKREARKLLYHLNDLRLASGQPTVKLTG